MTTLVPLNYDDVLARFEGKDSMPTLPDTFFKIMEITTDPVANVLDLVDIINHDPVLLADVLRVANTAYFGLRQPVQDLSTAVLLLGTGQISRIAIAAGYFKLFKGNRTAGKFIENLWLHSVGTALVAGKIGTEGDFSFASETYVAGLLHDLGKFFFATFYPDLYLQVRRDIAQSTINGLDLEKHIFGLNHLDAAQELCSRWRIPPRITTVATFHHHPLKVETDTKSLVLCVAISNIYAHKALKDEAAPHDPSEVDQWWSYLRTETKKSPFEQADWEPVLFKEAELARQFANILTREAQELGES